ncbi:FIG00005326: uncharacterized protein [hydrothermal vent metagenome]|uniref:FIG00005326: uncharacterized protein n=1 Tax=hydrothermal vent metagenome TaxID=652676 RepID=A0A3B0WD59_9ZZZZ
MCFMKNCQSKNLFEQATDCLLEKNPEKKVAETLLLQKNFLKGKLVTDLMTDIQALPVPGRPNKPALVAPKDVPKRSFISLKGRLILVHAIAHIEFNAINLALDAVYRFQDMPAQYYSDWCRVAAEEAQHFTMLCNYLLSHGVSYGDFSAHNGLWEMAVKTDFDVLVRMALVPRVLEARGLDVTPNMIKKLQPTGDTQLIKILEKIFHDEIEHVKIGTFWYKTLCEERQLEPEKTFLQLIEKYMQGAKFGPFETEARVKAGFSHKEMQALLNRF